MRFLPSTEQRDFAAGLDALLAASDVPAAIRARAGGDPAPVRALWRRLAASDVFALGCPERFGGTGLMPLELALACVELGRHAVPGPLAETFAGSVLLDDTGAADESGRWLDQVVRGEAVLTLALPVNGPYAPDADLADGLLHVDGETLYAAEPPGQGLPSLDPARRLFRPSGGTLLAAGPRVTESAAHAAEVAVLCTAALALGTGRRLLAGTVEYVGSRVQFGTPIGGFQAVKHRLADVLLQLEFAEPLLYAAALGLRDRSPGAGRDLPAAKAACGEAGYAAARAALQLHGAIGYTDEFDLSLWIRRARVLRSAWGAPSACRRAVLTGHVTAQKSTTGPLVR
ncbi:acyl-CoA dehydrogenase family protein [Streptacidiphilus sp. N1-3]|uniref:Acyl-CoA dehydrogenase family protein n=1 Tax=Streptacidiphilus alkalitolerans TaxID=3342712 RepID=A0ABV6XA34_9ACTN